MYFFLFFLFFLKIFSQNIVVWYLYLFGFENRIRMVQIIIINVVFGVKVESHMDNIMIKVIYIIHMRPWCVVGLLFCLLFVVLCYWRVRDVRVSRSSQDCVMGLFRVAGDQRKLRKKKLKNWPDYLFPLLLILFFFLCLYITGRVRDSKFCNCR